MPKKATPPPTPVGDTLLDEPKIGGDATEPKSKTDGKKPAGNARGINATIKKVEDGMGGLIDSIAGSLIVAGAVGGNPKLAYDGEVIAANRDRIVSELSDLARRNDRVRKVLLALIDSVGLGSLILVAAQVVVPIAVAHGIIPESSLALAPNAPKLPDSLRRPLASVSPLVDDDEEPHRRIRPTVIGHRQREPGMEKVLEWKDSRCGHRLSPACIFNLLNGRAVVMPFFCYSDN